VRKDRRKIDYVPDTNFWPLSEFRRMAEMAFGSKMRISQALPLSACD
jgi:hypothetical protein